MPDMPDMPDDEDLITVALASSLEAIADAIWMEIVEDARARGTVEA